MVILPARQVVQKAWDERFNFHPSGEFLWFEKWCPWKEHVFDMEKENGLVGKIKFAFYKDGRKMYRI